MPKKLTKEEFAEKSRLIYGDKYNYDHVEYKGNQCKVIIECREHGIFSQTPHGHLSGKEGCKKCNSINSTNRQKCYDGSWLLVKTN